jgi:hypothetical protein
MWKTPHTFAASLHRRNQTPNPPNMNITEEMTHIQKQNELKDKAMLFDQMIARIDALVDRVSAGDDKESLFDMYAEFSLKMLEIRQEAKNYGF